MSETLGVMDRDDDFRPDLEAMGCFESNKPRRKILKPSPSFKEQG